MAVAGHSNNKVDLGSGKFSQAVTLVDSSANEVNPAAPAATIADGADVAQGAVADAAVTTDANGTLNAHLRGVVTILGAVTASPVANTVGDRLKALLTGITLAAGTNAIGKLAANSGVDIGDVDVTSTVLPAGGTPTAGTKELTTTAAAALGSAACKSVIVQNDPDNTVDVLIGDATSQVIQLAPGDSISLPVSNISTVYAKNVSSTTQSVNFISVN